MRAFTLLLICLGLAARLHGQASRTPQFSQPAPVPQDRVKDSYDIYSLLLKSGPIEWRNTPRKQWLIEDTTNAISLDIPCDAGFGISMDPHTAVTAPKDRLTQWNEVLGDYNQHCHDVVQLDQKDFKTELPVRLLNAVDRQLFQNDPHRPPAQFADAAGLHRFTEVFFNPDHTLALVEQGMWCGSLCGNWTWVVLERRAGEWQILPWTSTTSIS